MWDSISTEILNQYSLSVDENIRTAQGFDIIDKSEVTASFTEKGKKYPLTPLFRTINSPKGTTEHQHDFLEIIFIIQGTGWHIINGKRNRIQAGEIFFINTAKKHYYQSDEGESFSYISFSFYPSLINPILTMQKINAGLNYWLIEPFFFDHPEKGAAWFQVNPQSFFKLSNLALLIIDRFNNSYPAVSIEVTDLFKSFVSIVYQLFSREITEKDNSHQKIEKVFWNMINEIEKRLHKKFTLDDIAMSVGLGRTRASEIFKNIEGESIIEYARRRRTEKAAKLLIDSDMPILEIAYESGFHDLSYFNRTFKNYYNISPSNYRLQR